MKAVFVLLVVGISLSGIWLVLDAMIDNSVQNSELFFLFHPGLIVFYALGCAGIIELMKKYTKIFQS